MGIITRLAKNPIERNSKIIIGLRQDDAREFGNFSLFHLDTLTGLNFLTFTNYGCSHKKG